MAGGRDRSRVLCLSGHSGITGVATEFSNNDRCTHRDDRGRDIASVILSPMDGRVVEFVRTSLDARQVAVETRLQALWGGQGSLFRVSTDVPRHDTVMSSALLHGRIPPTLAAGVPRVHSCAKERSYYFTAWLDAWAHQDQSLHGGSGRSGVGRQVGNTEVTRRQYRL